MEGGRRETRDIGCPVDPPTNGQAVNLRRAFVTLVDRGVLSPLDGTTWWVEWYPGDDGRYRFRLLTWFLPVDVIERLAFAGQPVQLHVVFTPDPLPFFDGDVLVDRRFYWDRLDKYRYAFSEDVDLGAAIVRY